MVWLGVDAWQSGSSSRSEPQDPSTNPFTHRCRASATAESTSCMGFSDAAIDGANHGDGQSNKRSPSFGLTIEHAFRPARGVGYEPTCCTGVEPVTARVLIWCSTSELTSFMASCQKPCSEQSEQTPAGAPPAAGTTPSMLSIQRDAGGSRTHWMRLCRPPPHRVTSTSVSVLARSRT